MWAGPCSRPPPPTCLGPASLGSPCYSQTRQLLQARPLSDQRELCCSGEASRPAPRPRATWATGAAVLCPALPAFGTQPPHQGLRSWAPLPSIFLQTTPGHRHPGALHSRPLRLAFNPWWAWGHSGSQTRVVWLYFGGPLEEVF